MAANMLRQAAGIAAVCLPLAMALGPRASFGAHEAANALAHAASPYLRLHAHDPVHWREWSPELVARAGSEDRLIFVSVGYFACHWCHVMQRESFSDPDVAALLNAHFVSSRSIASSTPLSTRSSSGSCRPRWAMRDGRSTSCSRRRESPCSGSPTSPSRTSRGFWIRSWADGRAMIGATLASAARSVSEALASAMRPSPAEAMDAAGVRALNDAFTQQASEMADGLAGGFGQQQKFPSAPQLALLLDAQRREPSEALGEFLRLTFGAMASLGLRDQIGGGFFRYTVDPAWQVPHFEKMLYDNALLAELYFDAADVLGEPAFERVAMDTVRFMVRELGSPLGGFYSSLSAVDADGVEGGYYLFDAEELDRVLDGGERRVAGIAWGLDGASPIEHGYLPVQSAESGAEVARAAGVSVEEATARLDSARSRLLEVRGTARASARRQASRGVERSCALGAGARIATPRRRTVRGAGPRRRALSRRGAPGRYEAGTGAIRKWGRRGDRRRGRQGSGRADPDPGDVAGLRLRRARPDRVREGAREARSTGPLRAGSWKARGSAFVPPRAGVCPTRAGFPTPGVEPALADGPMPSPSAVLLDATMHVADRFDDDALRERARAALLAGDAGMRQGAFFHATRIRALLRWRLDRTH